MLLIILYNYVVFIMRVTVSIHSGMVRQRIQRNYILYHKRLLVKKLTDGRHKMAHAVGY